MQDGASVWLAGLSTNSAPSAQPSCVPADGSLCRAVTELTGNALLGRYTDSIVDATVSIVAIMLVAVVLRFVVHRAINRLIAKVGSGTSYSWLRARERNGGQPAAGPPARSAERRIQRAQTMGSLLRSASSFSIYGIAGMMVLTEFGINVGPILASAGVLGLAIGFGAQNLVRDFLSGILMMLEDQYGVGDFVDLGEAVGDVETVSLRTTTIRDVSGTVWYVRNGEILRVGNFSKGFAVAVVDVPLAHHADTQRASELARQAAQEVAEGEHSEDIIEPPQLLGVQSVTPYALTLRLTAKTKPGRQWAVQRSLNARVQSALTTAEIPAPVIARLPTPSG